MAVRADPALAQARAALQSALAQRPNPPLAEERLHDALALEPEIAFPERCYACAPSFSGIDRARELLEDAVRLDPALVQAHAALATVLAREEHAVLAMAEYRRTLEIDPQQAQAALALSELLFNSGETTASAHYRELALGRQQLYPAGPSSARAAHGVLVLNAPAPWAENTPLEFMVDPNCAALHRLYLTSDRIPRLPEYHVVFNAIGEAERAHPALERARSFIASQSRPVINAPENVWKTSRARVADTLNGISNCVTVATRRVAREEARESAQFPLLIRPIDTHAGRGLARIDGVQHLDAYLGEHADDRFDLTPFVDYRSADGYYRKYRVVLVGGTPYPYHLAISPEWMVHYISSPTAHVDWMRAEEERFLREPESVFPHWEATLGAIARAFALDYVGIDCSLLPTGEILVFEADSALLVHCREPARSYKHAYVPKIFRAVEALIAQRANDEPSAQTP